MDGGTRPPAGSTKTRPKLAPPPPKTRASAKASKPKIGAPYEVPALILHEGGRAKLTAPPSQPWARPELHDERRPRVAAPRPNLPRPARLPGPKLRAPTHRAPPRSPSPPPPPPAALLPRESLSPALSAPSGAPDVVAAQDTDALVRSLAVELGGQDPLAPPQLPAPPAASQWRKPMFFVSMVLGLLSVLALLLPAEPPQTRERAALDAQAQPQSAPDVDVDVAAPAASEQPLASPAAQLRSELEPTLASPAPQPARVRGGPRDTRSASELRAAAQAAYDAGQATQAYKLAFISWRRSNKSKTAELMALSACKMQDEAKLEASLAKLPRARRSAIRRACEDLSAAQP